MTVANGNTSVGLLVKPANLSTACANLSKAFRFYRILKLSVNFDPIVRFETTVPTNAGAGAWTAAYIPEGTSASLTATGYSTLREVPDSVGGMAQVVNSNITDNSSLAAGYPGFLLIPGDTTQRRLRVKPKSLRVGSQRMYFTQGTDGITTDQGILLFAVADSAGGNTVIATATIFYSVLFMEPLDSVNLGVSPFGTKLKPFGAIPKVAEKEDVDESKSELGSVVEVANSTDQEQASLQDLRRDLRLVLARVKYASPSSS